LPPSADALRMLMDHRPFLCYDSHLRSMFPESFLNMLAGGVLGIAGSLAVWLIRDGIENRRRRMRLIDAIDAAARSSMLPAIMSAYSGRTDYFSPAAQFLPTFWRDLPLLGTMTQMEVVDFFSMVNNVMSRGGPQSKEHLDLLGKMRENLTKSLELERKGKQRNVKSPSSTRSQVRCV